MGYKKYMKQKLFQKLKNAVEPCKAIFGFGFIKARNYERNKNGHLFIFRLNYKKLVIIKKVFINF